MYQSALLVTVAVVNCHTANPPVVPRVTVQAWAPPAPGSTGQISEIICFQNLRNFPNQLTTPPHCNYSRTTDYSSNGSNSSQTLSSQFKQSSGQPFLSRHVPQMDLKWT